MGYYLVSEEDLKRLEQLDNERYSRYGTGINLSDVEDVLTMVDLDSFVSKWYFYYASDAEWLDMTIKPSEAFEKWREQ